METITDAVKPIDIPSHLKAGEIFMYNEIPYVITRVEPILDPWTHQSALTIRLSQSDTRIVFLVLTCRDCSTQVAVRFNLANEIEGWLQLKAGTNITWLCPDCRMEHGL